MVSGPRRDLTVRMTVEEPRILRRLAPAGIHVPVFSRVIKRKSPEQ